ncbi:MAG: hypothetical protein Tsb0014_16490 [Pleurocapsa sp.]
MSWLYGNDVVQKLGDNAFLYDLSKMRGVSAILNRIPDNMPGVYAWYRNFKIDAAAHNDPDAFVSNILQELYKPHCVTRETRLPPSHRLIVKPETILSQRKQEALKYYAANPDFRELLITLLNNCLLFQQPLYIGKASNLRTRISNHLGVESVLRERLKEAEHDLEQCRLLLLSCSENINYCISENIESEQENENEFSQLEPEALIEDILSRLFLPSFAINYG